MKLRIDPIACDAHGLCIELLPELIAVDDWGYPMLLTDTVPRELGALARQTESACPTLAITLDDGD